MDGKVVDGRGNKIQSWRQQQRDSIPLVRYTECESRRYRGNFYVSSSASSTPSLSSSLLFVSNLRDGLTTGSINLLFTFAFALEIARGLF